MKVLAINAIASIQDLGRFGSRSMGVGRNGVMDKWAYQTGNALMNNALDEPALEITMGSLTLEFEQDVSFCLTGALYEAYLDDERIAGYWRINASTGQTLKLIRPIKGMYTYLCLHGGFDINSVLGSYSTNPKAEFGGFKGRYIKQGDIIPEGCTVNIKATETSHSLEQKLPLPKIGVASIKPTPIIRVVKSSEYDYFTADAKQLFVTQKWQLETSSNRMGYRFKAETPLELIKPIQMNSHGVDMGMIQVPPQGLPIILMADSQTTGGYPKIATVIEADIGLLSQTRYGKACQFSLVTVDEAIHAREDRRRYIKRIQEYANEN